jgi:sulfide:quinone oxidoreductase
MSFQSLSPVSAPARRAGTARSADREHEVVIVGGGAAGVATAASLLARVPSLDVAIIEPAETHNYQPGWTLVGAGEFDLTKTERPMETVMPAGVAWIKAAATGFDPSRSMVLLDGGDTVKYRRLVVCPGLTLNWDAIEGLRDTLGRNGVTSNYRGELAAYTWKLVRELRGGRALFTQPPMPIKCAGAPQKAMYLSADHWKRTGTLGDTKVEFCSAANALFGVADYVPPLMEYVNAYGVQLNFAENLVAVDGERRVATFSKQAADGGVTRIEREFDLLHVVPPQVAPEFVRNSPLANASGWVDVDPATLRHQRYPEIFSLGDVAGTSNAKTAAAARKQAPVVAHNVLASLGKARGVAAYDGYGSCPLTVERGKVVLAEFGYGGKLAPSFPSWLIESTKASRLTWMLKKHVLPALYWNGMLKGHELMAQPLISNV